ncbi:MAG: T9SS type A sorting domain-containing protein, partial [Pseudomonadota bacterium]
EETALTEETPVVNNAHVSVYPNPADNHVNFSFQDLNENEIISMVMYDLSGREIISLSAAWVEIQNLFNNDFVKANLGIYILQIESATLHQKIKLVKM